MSLQTEIKNEKALFAELIKKIKQSKTFKEIGRKESHRKYIFDTFVIDLELGGGDEHEVFSVMDKQGKMLFTRDCGVPDVEGDALKICEARWDLVQELYTALNKREEQESEKKEKAEALKRAAMRVKLTKVIRKKQEADAAKISKVLEQIKSL